MARRSGLERPPLAHGIVAFFFLLFVFFLLQLPLSALGRRLPGSFWHPGGGGGGGGGSCAGPLARAGHTLAQCSPPTPPAGRRAQPRNLPGRPKREASGCFGPQRATANGTKREEALAAPSLPEAQKKKLLPWLFPQLPPLQPASLLRHLEALELLPPHQPPSSAKEKRGGGGGLPARFLLFCTVFPIKAHLATRGR